MRKKLLIIFIVSFSIFIFSSQTIFANGNNDKSNSNVEAENVSNEFSYSVVSEEEVILDYMTKENVDRDTAIKKLGISEFKLAACIYQWRHYTSPEREVESISNVSLTLTPYVQVRDCGGDETFLSVSSSQPAHQFYGLFQGMGRLTQAGAILTSSKRIDVHASGYIDPLVGSNRYWNYSACIGADRSGSGSVGCF